MFQFIETMQPDLQQMESLMEREFQLRSGHVSRFVSLELDRVDKYLYPAMLLLFSRMFIVGAKKSVPMACVIQFIRYATCVHSYDGKRPQYPVLIGDYLYSNFFFYLSKFQAVDKLKPLAASICQIHEGGIIKKEKIETGKAGNNDFVAAAEKEHGILLGEACRIGVQLAGELGEMQETAYAFGRNFGTAWGLLRSGFKKISPDKYLQQAKACTYGLPDGSERKLLALAIDDILSYYKTEKFMVG